MMRRCSGIIDLLLVVTVCSWAGGPAGSEERVPVRGVKAPVEILRDRWGVPHIYARNAHDLFFAQGYTAARDRLFQIDLWRRAGSGHLSEVLGPAALDRDRLARLVRFRGDWNAEWTSYSPDARDIAAAFTSGINSFIQSLNGKRPKEFAAAGYDPATWRPEDVTARMAGLLMMRNLTSEVQRAVRVKKHGLAREAELFPPDPPVALKLPDGLALDDISEDILAVVRSAVRAAGGDGETETTGSNNWVVDGTRTVTGKPLLANDPHRPILIPSLRKTVHLVAPGWNVIGAGEPALPGIALGHNERIGFGFTIVGIDQQDLYVERTNPSDFNQYRSEGAWRPMRVERETIAVKGAASAEVELRFTRHGPVLWEDHKRHRAYALKWVGAEPGGAGYLSALRLSRAGNWREFREAARFYKVPSENLVYADTDGNIGWIAAGQAPVRQNWTGLFPVPGDSGKYEWQGWMPVEDHPQLYNPPSHWIATANHDILPQGYNRQLSYEWALPFRFLRIREMLAGKDKFTIGDFAAMQQDVVSLPARRFQKILRRERPRLSGVAAAKADEILAWDGILRTDSAPAFSYEVWMDALFPAVFEAGMRPSLAVLLDRLESIQDASGILEKTAAAVEQRRKSKWGEVHTAAFHHPAGVAEWNRGPVPRPGDGNTVNATGGSAFRQTAGASYREILDLSDWDRSVMTNVPGESGDPSSPHYSDLIDDWAAGRYHPMPYTRAAVEAATTERILLMPQ
jgi:penicillin amidase